MIAFENFSLLLSDRVDLLSRYPLQRTARVKNFFTELDILIANLVEVYCARDWCISPLR